MAVLVIAVGPGQTLVAVGAAGGRQNKTRETQFAGMPTLTGWRHGPTYCSAFFLFNKKSANGLRGIEFTVKQQLVQQSQLFLVSEARKPLVGHGPAPP